MQIHQLVDLFACAEILSALFLLLVCSKGKVIATNLEIAHQTASSSSRHDGRLGSGVQYESSTNGGYTLVDEILWR